MKTGEVRSPQSLQAAKIALQVAKRDLESAIAFIEAAIAHVEELQSGQQSLFTK